MPFRTLAVESGWNSTALYLAYPTQGLAYPTQERLLPLDLPPDLDSLIALAIRTADEPVVIMYQQILSIS